MLGVLNKLCAITMAATVPGSSGNAFDDWQVWFGESSGWGGVKGIYIDSTGRNVAYPLDRSREHAVDFRQGIPSIFCETSPLNEHQVRMFSFRIASIPSDALANGGLTFENSCFDVGAIGVTLKMYGRSYQFGYPHPQHCRDGEAVPSWLASLVKALSDRYHQIEDCTTTTTDAGSVP